MSFRRIAPFFFSFALLAASFSIMACSGRAAPVPTMDKTVGYLQIYVYDSANSAVPGAQVASQLQPAGQVKIDGTTTQDGSVTFTGIKPGKYEFLVSKAASSPAVASVDLAAGQPISIRLALEKAATP
jgi:hypothetical protein